MTAYLRCASFALAAICLAQQNTGVSHAIVYKEDGRFGGWPANHGIWSWGNEIAVGFSRAWFQDNPDEHSYARDKPSVFALARSRDGGETWTD